jgi:CheY-like chemotaxis protein
VDDETMLVEMATDVLHKLGYRVTARTNSTEALATFSENPSRYDLVITDQTMPGMTGDALARELMEIRSNLPVIVCTGYSQTLDPVRAQKIGIKALVMKPLLIHELAAAVKKALSQKLT